MTVIRQGAIDAQGRDGLGGPGIGAMSYTASKEDSDLALVPARRGDYIHMAWKSLLLLLRVLGSHGLVPPSRQVRLEN